MYYRKLIYVPGSRPNHPGADPGFDLIQSTKTHESFDSVLAYVGLKKEDLEPLSFYPLTEFSEWSSRPSEKDFKRRHDSGEIIMTPMSAYKISIEHVPLEIESPVREHSSLGWFRYVDRNKRRNEFLAPTERTNNFVLVGIDQKLVSYVHPRHYNCPLSLTPSELSEPSGALVAAAFAEANNGSTDLLTSLAEARETVNMIRSIIERLVSARKKLKQLPNSFIKKASDQWMEYRYGIMPLVYSMQGLLDSLNEMGRIYANFPEKEESSDVDTKVINGWKIHEQTTTIHRVLVKRRYDPNHILDSLNHFNINPLLTTWELIPYSFVIDWFINIGDVISALSSPAIYCDEKATYSRKLIRSSIAIHDSTGLTSRLSEEQYVRHLTTSADSRIEFNVNLNWKRTIDGFILSWPALRNSLRKLK